jgi:hypothetical protein
VTSKEDGYSTLVPKFAKGQTVFTSWGQEVVIDDIDVTVFIAYLSGDYFFNQDELHATNPKGQHPCAHKGPDGSFYGISTPPDEMDYEYPYCPKCAVPLRHSEPNWAGGK